MNPITKMEIHHHPYFHCVIDNFLDDKRHCEMDEVFNSLVFHEKHTDLFHFYQSDELNANPNLTFFLKELKRQALSLDIQSIESFNVFASFYQKGNYLLCHDDVIEDRRFAFSYYLADFETGELAMFNDNATMEVKRLSVKRNRLVIFEVSDISFHEVMYCKDDGRKAFTGWLNYKKIQEPNKKTEQVLVKYKEDKNDVFFEQNVDISQAINLVRDVTYELSDDIISTMGPFYCRKVRIIHSSNMVFKFFNLKLLHKFSIKLIEGDYILLNDAINDIEGDVYDFFYFGDCGENVDGIKYVNGEGEVEFEVSGHSNLGYLIRRSNMKIFIERVENGLAFEHFIYLN